MKKSYLQFSKKIILKFMKEWFQQFLKKIIPQITRISAFSEKIDSCNFRRKEFSGLCRKDFWNFWRKFLFQLRSIFCLSEKKKMIAFYEAYTLKGRTFQNGFSFKWFRISTIPYGRVDGKVIEFIIHE